MATRTLLAGDRSLTTEGRGEQHARLIEPYRRIEHGVYAQQANPYTRGPVNRLDDTRLLPESRYPLDYAQNTPYGQQKTAMTSGFGSTDDTRAGPMSGQIDQSRRTSELQPISDARISGDFPSIGASNRLTPPAYATLLPSFASIKESADRDDRQMPALELAVRQESPTCRGCVEKKSIIDDIAHAVTSLDELISRYGSRPTMRRPERPRDSSLRTAQWVLDCVQDARATLRGLSPRPVDHNSQRQADQVDSAMARSLSPTGASKRGPDDTESVEHDSTKRQRTASYHEGNLERFHVAGRLEEPRRASDCLQRTEPSRTFSPAHSDSRASSAQPQQQSPSIYGRSLRPLPSPSSMATASQKAFWNGPTAPPGGSPTSVNQGPTAIHTASTSTAASQHIAELQHQVTLKSLSLQTLQSEYTSLLQKSQRDRLKSQTFEKKATAADQEINEMTARNEELIEQVRTLETQLEECEKKREMERSDAVREKDQWGRMLEMSGRLQAKNADDRQKLVQEKESLQQRLLIYENEAALSVKRRASQSQKALPASSQDAGGNEASRQANEDSKEDAARIAALQRENEMWQRRTYLLRSVLERMEEQYASFMEKRRKLLEQEITGIPDVIQMALREDSAFARPTGYQSEDARSSEYDGPRIAEKRGSLDVSSVLGNDRSLVIKQSTNATDERKEKVNPPALSPTEQMHNAQAIPSQSAQDGTDSKSTPRPKLQAVPLPKWQPPGKPYLRTEPLGNNQRRPSGPATPFPGTESTSWQISDAVPAPEFKPLGKKSSPPATGPLPAYNLEKTPARDYTPQYAPLPRQSVTGSDYSDRYAPDAAAMPPPPRPGAETASTPSASWRSS
ncbi:hypothetical protein MBLNU13_g10288t2 [Cladosporium sp. NU13]